MGNELYDGSIVVAELQAFIHVRETHTMQGITGKDINDLAVDKRKPTTGITYALRAILDYLEPVFNKGN